MEHAVPSAFFSNINHSVLGTNRRSATQSYGWQAARTTFSLSDLSVSAVVNPLLSLPSRFVNNSVLTVIFYYLVFIAVKLKILLSLPVLLCLGWVSTQASIANSNWTGAVDSDFNEGLNWSSGVPGPSNIGEFNLGITHTVTFDSSPATAHSIEIENDTVIFDLSPGVPSETLNLTNKLTLAHNNGDSAILAIKNGTVNASNLETSKNFNTLFSQLDIGDFGGSTGILNITDTADIGIDGPSFVNVYNTGSIFSTDILNVGVNEFGLVDVIDGGLAKVINASTLTLGVNSGSDGKFALDGVGSELHMGAQVGEPEGSIIVGDGGKGTFHVHNSATPQIDASVIIGNQATSSASELRVDTQSGPGSTLSINDVYVGNLGEGLLQVLDNSVLTADSIMVGSLGIVKGGGDIISDIDNFGRITVDNSFNLEVDGSVTFNSGSFLDITVFDTGEGPGANFLRILDDTSGTGNLTFSSGTLNVFLNEFVPLLGDNILAISWDGLLSGTFDSITVDPGGLSLAPGQFFQPDYDELAGDLTLTVVPEPSTWALMGLGCLLIFWRVRRRS